MNLAVAKPVHESLWHGLSNEARYKAKPIVYTLANQWGSGSAAFLGSFINKMLDLLGVKPDGEGVCMIVGFPPILIFCPASQWCWRVHGTGLWPAQNPSIDALDSSAGRPGTGMIMNLAVAKPVRESLWHGLSNKARYEAKPIVDTLANRWGGGSAAFLVSFINKMLDLLGVEPDGEGVCMIVGFPPILFLCMLIATWWTVVSADLGTI